MGFSGSFPLKRRAARRVGAKFSAESPYMPLDIGVGMPK
jgi:hypothetical protein